MTDCNFSTCSNSDNTSNNAGDLSKQYLLLTDFQTCKKRMYFLIIILFILVVIK